MTDRLTDEQLDHIIETHRGTLAGAAKKKQVYAPVENLEQTIRGLEEAKERRAEARADKVRPAPGGHRPVRILRHFTVPCSAWETRPLPDLTGDV